MKYIYVRVGKTLRVKRLSVTEETFSTITAITDDGSARVFDKQTQVAFHYSVKSSINASVLDDYANLRIISYDEYRTMRNGLINVKIKALHEERLFIQKRNWELVRALQTELLPIDEVTE